MEDDRLKHLRSALDETVFKGTHFTDKNREAVFNKIHNLPKRKRRTFFGNLRTWLKPALSTAFCLAMIIGIFYTISQNSLKTPNLAGRGNHTLSQSSSMSDATKSTSKSSLTVKDMSQITAVRLADPQTGWVGGKGWIAKTSNGGKQWVIQYKTNSSQTAQQVFALNHQEVWATLTQGADTSTPARLIHSTNGGESWTSVGFVPNNGFLHFISQNQAFSANAETSDGGRSWYSIPVPKNVVGQAYFHDQLRGWAVTYSNNVMRIQHTLDGGQTWETTMSSQGVPALHDAVIRSESPNDAWVELIGDSGMTQTSYSLFHTTDGGKTWGTVIANSTSGGGPAPGFTMSSGTNEPHNSGSQPGALYVASTNVAFMGGQCQACTHPNTIGWTTDGGKTWQNGTVSLDGHGPQLLGIADANNGWWITTEPGKSSVMYTTSDGGLHWQKVYTFK